MIKFAKKILGIKPKDDKSSQVTDHNRLMEINDWLNQVIIDNYQRICSNKMNENFDFGQVIKEITKAPEYLIVDSRHHHLNLLFGTQPWRFVKNFEHIAQYYLVWGIRPAYGTSLSIQLAQKLNRPAIFVEDGYLRSVSTYLDKIIEEKFQRGISFIFDDLTPCYDATRPSRLELMLNNKNFIVTENQKERARACIDKIVENHLTKYNHQPIFTPKIGRDGVKKVLIIDQAYGDMSIVKGFGNQETFDEMLNTAIVENPDADIIIKTHPDTMAQKIGGYYTNIEQNGNIYLLKEPVNPISLIKYVDKVYVVSTQFGFEALMCGKEVHVFGLPFYAGWGLTNDRQKCDRRTNTRTLEEIFYITYIVYSYYVNPKTQSKCEIEEAMDYLLELRDEHFKNRGLK